MAITKDWITEAAREIVTGDFRSGLGDQFYASAIQQVADIIKKHCPFKENVAYEEVKGRRNT